MRCHACLPDRARLHDARRVLAERERGREAGKEAGREEVGGWWGGGGREKETMARTGRKRTSLIIHTVKTEPVIAAAVSIPPIPPLPAVSTAPQPLPEPHSRSPLSLPSQNTLPAR